MTCELCEVLLTVPYFYFIFIFLLITDTSTWSLCLTTICQGQLDYEFFSFIHASVLVQKKAASDESNDMPVQPTGTLQLFDATPNMAPIHSKPYD